MSVITPESEKKWHVHFTSGEKIKWALDEDLRMARESLGSSVVSCSLPTARIVHSAWWPHVISYGPEALRGKHVVCFADNPPSFYLTQPGFVAAARRVDLWIARTREALAQFQTLGLPTAYAPYNVDDSIFHPTKAAPSLKQSLNLPDDAFVIGNFHRDSEGVNLNRPKRQKGPDILLEIARLLYPRLPRLVVLLAGPRRHYLKKQLESDGIPFRLCTNVPVEEEDDFEANILPREKLNELYQLLDVCVISSRWEGGPHSLLEALFAGRHVISTPVGIARDILPSECLFRSPEEAAELLLRHAESDTLDGSTQQAREKAREKNNVSTLREHLLKAYLDLPVGGLPLSAAAFSAFGALRSRLTSAQEFAHHARATTTERLMQELKILPKTNAWLGETPLDPTDPHAASELLAAAAMCRDANLHP